MRNKYSGLHLLASRAAIQGQFQTGVCLHGHTQHSRESLGFIARILETPIAALLTKNGLKRYESTHGEKLDFNRAYWTSPLSPREAYDLERAQIEEKLDLDALISLTDHDSIEGCVSLQDEDSPISMEWTVPYPPAYLHLGVHNLPISTASEWAGRLLRCAQQGDQRLVAEHLAALHKIPSVLLVLNHPLWEMEPIGADRVLEMVQAFLGRYGNFIHALELNGLRPWRENRRVMTLATETGYPLVSGGDRHGWEPSAMLNLTNAATFAEFVSEVREDRQSEIVIMDQYDDPINYRMLQVVWDMFREYPRHSVGKCFWTDRVYFELPGKLAKPISRCWKKFPRELKHLTQMMNALQTPPLQAALRYFFADGQRSLT